MAFKDWKRLTYIVALTLITVLHSVADGLDPPEASQFEAAFQGRCGQGSPCTQLCRELHDGTYECGCLPGHILNKDGYSCQELNSSAKSILENYVDSEEDVLYQKDASFSAELDIALVPAKDNETATSSSSKESTTRTSIRKTTSLLEVITTMPNFKYFQTQAFANEDDANGEMDSAFQPSERLNKHFDSNTIPYYHEYNSKSVQRHGTQGTPLYNRQNMEISSMKTGTKKSNNDNWKLPPTIETYVENSQEITNTELADAKENEYAETTTWLWDNDENKKGDEDEEPLITTTLGPSLEQKVPPMSTSGPGHTESAPRSGCPLGKMGPNCDKVAPAPVAPHFSDGSWLALPALRGAYKRVHLHMEFRPTSKDGLLLLTGERSDMTGDYLVLFLHRGYIELRFDCGSGPGVVKSDTTVLPNQWNSLTLYRRRWDAWIQLNGGRHVQGRSKGLFSRMTFLDAVYVGGRNNISGFEKLPVQTGYEGCIRSLNINGRSYNWALRPRGDTLTGYNIGECTVGGCGRGCLHGGRCLTQCLCPLGYAGDYCQTVLDLQVPRFNGSSFLRYPGMKNTALSWLELQVTLKPTTKDGLIMYNAHRNDGIGDFFALYLKNSQAEFTFDLGTGQATIKNPKEMKLNNWYTISLSRTGRLAVLNVVSYGLSSDPEEIPGLITAQGLAPGAFTQLSLSQNLYLGGAPQFHIIQKKINISDSFSGCIQKVVINDHEQTIVSSALGGVNIDGCPHACSANPCGKAICKPHLHNYKCICNPGDANNKCTDFLNETDNSKNFFIRRSHILGEEKKPQLSNYNSHSIHNTIVAKKGPRVQFIHQSHILREKSRNDTKNWNLNRKQMAQKEFIEKNEEIGYQEWILNKNYNKPKYMTMKDEKSVSDNEEDTYKLKKIPNQKWLNKKNNQIYSANSDNDLDIPNFKGENSYIKKNDFEILKRLNGHSIDINIRFKSIKSIGLLLWISKDGMIPGDTFMALAIEDGYLTFRYDLGSGEVIIVANQTKVDDGLWHRARVTRKGQSGVLDIDGLGAIGKVSPGHMKALNIDTGLYIGGMPSIWPETLGRYDSGLIGCISMLTLDREYQIPINLKSDKYTTVKNVRKCPP